MEIYSREMAREFEKIGATTVLALPGRANGQPPSFYALAAFALKCAWYLLRHAKEHDVVLFGDLVLAPLAVFCRLGSSRARTGVAIHGTDIAFHIRKGPWAKLYRIYLLLIASLQRTAIDALVANSEATARHSREVGLHDVQVVPLGVHLPDPVESSSEKRNILFVGRIMPRKGAAWFAENVLPHLADDVRFLVAGTEWDDEEVARLAGNERVTLLGPIFGLELQRHRASALAVVVPNIPLGGRDFEGFGLVALEAAAAGGVVLAADLDGISSAIVNGETGFLLPAQDADAWQRQIRLIMTWTDEERASFVQGARSCLADKFTWERTARMTLSACAQERAPTSGDLRALVA
jgi:glycosyltransferase involved in cell wall biosynthesis